MANKIPNRQAICDTLLKAAATDKDIVVLCSDSRGSASLTKFADTYPEQFVEMGIAEQDLVSVAAGLASCGKKAFAASPACFLTTRSYEQAKIDCAYSNTNVTLIGISGGVSYGALGMSHHSAQDIAAMSAIPNMRVYLPSDRFQTAKLVEALLRDTKPAYLRVGRNPVEDVYTEDACPFEMDKATVLAEGSDVAIIACGEMVRPALDAAELRSAPALVPHEAHGVAVVHHHQGVKLIGQIADPLEVGDVAVHGEYAVGGNQQLLAAGSPGVLQAAAEIFHIVVLVAVPLGLAQPHTVNDGGVVQLVGDDRVLRPQKGLEQTAVGIEAGGVQNGVLHAGEGGNFLFQLLVDGLGAADKPDGGEAEAPLVIAVLGGGNQLRVIGKTQIVVGAQVYHGLLGGGVNPGALGSGDDSLLPPGAGLPDGVQLLLKSFQCRFHGVYLLISSSPEPPCRSCR